MPPSNPPPTTRRRVLAALGSASIPIIVGCSAPSKRHTRTQSARSATPNSTTSKNPPTSNITTTSTPTNSFDFDFTPTTGTELWDTPAGVPAYADDPNWRCIGHDTGNTGHNPHASGPESNPTARWTYQGDGNYFEGWDNYHPLIVDGIVFVAFQRDGGRTNGVVAIEAESGNSQVILETESRIWHPSIIDGTLYAALDNSVAAFSLEDGSRRWRTDHLLRLPAAVRRVGDVVVATDDEHLYGIDAAKGDVLWEISGPGGVGGSIWIPACADGEIAPFLMERLRTRRNGSPSGSLPTPIMYPVLKDGVLYGQPDLSTPSELISVDWNTLEPRWRITPNEDELQIFGGFVSAHGNVVVAYERGETAVGRDQQTGETLWSTDLPYLNPIFGASDQETIYLSCPGGAVVALDPTNGSIKWSYEPPGAGSRGNGIALADDLLVIVDQSGTVTALE